MIVCARLFVLKTKVLVQELSGQGPGTRGQECRVQNGEWGMFQIRSARVVERLLRFDRSVTVAALIDQVAALMVRTTDFCASPELLRRYRMCPADGLFDDGGASLERRRLPRKHFAICNPENSVSSVKKLTLHSSSLDFSVKID